MTNAWTLSTADGPTAGDPHVHLGAAWYPEQTPREDWEADAEAIRASGIGVVRIGEFAWTLMEPAAGRFELDWVQDAVATAADAGLGVVLCTPTAEPPAWLYEQHPAIRRTTADGRVAKFAMESRYCTTSPELLKATERIVGALAERFGDHDAVVGWQLDNEFSAGCHCSGCERAFRAWLEERYGTLEELNRRWGTAFRNEVYTAWSQIPLPDTTVLYPGPALALERRRFHSDTFVRYARRQAEILRAHVRPEVPITHNLIPPRHFDEIDYLALAGELDVVGWDNYPLLTGDPHWGNAAFEADLVRGFKRQPFWVMEQQTSGLGTDRLISPRRGQTRLWCWQAIAHGASALFFFRWRTAQRGYEQHWLGVLDWNGRRGRAHAMVRELAGEIAQRGDQLAGLEPLAEAAVLHDYDSRYALATLPGNDALAYVPTLQRHHEALRRLTVGTDVVAPEADLGAYRLIAAPDLAVMDEDRGAALAAWVHDGGTLVLAPRTAFQDRDAGMPGRPLPGWLHELAGVQSVELHSSPKGTAETMAYAGTLDGSFEGWVEELEVSDAEVLAVQSDGPMPGAPAITRRRHGAGTAFVVAGALTADAANAFYAWLAAELGLSTAALPDDVEGVRCTNARGERLMVLLNHSEVAQRVDGVDLGPYGVKIIELADG